MEDLKKDLINLFSTKTFVSVDKDSSFYEVFITDRNRECQIMFSFVKDGFCCEVEKDNFHFRYAYLNDRLIMEFEGKEYNLTDRKICGKIWANAPSMDELNQFYKALETAIGYANEVMSNNMKLHSDYFKKK